MRELIKNPFFRVVGIGLILYYGLFNNTQTPDGLGNRLSPSKVKDGLSQATRQGKHIVGTLKKANKLKESKEGDAENTITPVVK
jgi:hypothetical protein